MTDVLTNHLSGLIEIANRAIEVREAEKVAELEKDELHAAYDDHKRRVGIGHVTRDTPAWDAMMEATKAEYAASEIAKRKVYNAKRRLRKSIDSFTS